MAIFSVQQIKTDAFLLSLRSHLRSLMHLCYTLSKNNLILVCTNLNTNTNTVKFTINRKDLQEVFFPLLSYHGLFFITDARRAQYDRVVYVIKHGLTRFTEIPATVPSLYPLPITAAGYIGLPFFND